MTTREIHAANKRDAVRALVYLANVEAPGVSVVRHALVSISKRSTYALAVQENNGDDVNSGEL